MRIKIKKIHPDAIIPKYATVGAAGMDLFGYLTDNITIEAYHRFQVPTGISIALPPGWEGQVRPRSGLALRSGLTVLNSPGTIDGDYRGEIMVLLINLGKSAVTITPGQRIAQLVIAPVVQAELIEADELDDTARGTGGFGSTGGRNDQLVASAAIARSGVGAQLARGARAGEQRRRQEQENHRKRFDSMDLESPQEVAERLNRAMQDSIERRGLSGTLTD